MNIKINWKCVIIRNVCYGMLDCKSSNAQHTHLSYVQTAHPPSYVRSGTAKQPTTWQVKRTTQQIHAHVLVLTFKYSFRDEFNFRGERGASIRMHHQHCFAILKLYLWSTHVCVGVVQGEGLGWRCCDMREGEIGNERRNRTRTGGKKNAFIST